MYLCGLPPTRVAGLSPAVYILAPGLPLGCDHKSVSTAHWPMTRRGAGHHLYGILLQTLVTPASSTKGINWSLPFRTRSPEEQRTEQQQQQLSSSSSRSRSSSRSHGSGGAGAGRGLGKEGSGKEGGWREVSHGKTEPPRCSMGKQSLQGVAWANSATRCSMGKQSLQGVAWENRASKV